MDEKDEEALGELVNRLRDMQKSFRSDKTGSKVERLVKDCGYLFFNIDDRKLTVRRTKSIEKSDFTNYLLCGEKTAKSLGLLDRPSPRSKAGPKTSKEGFSSFLISPRSQRKEVGTMAPRSCPTT